MICIRCVEVDDLFYQSLTKHITVKIHIPLGIARYRGDVTQALDWFHLSFSL